MGASLALYTRPGPVLLWATLWPVSNAVRQTTAFSIGDWRLHFIQPPPAVAPGAKQKTVGNSRTVSQNKSIFYACVDRKGWD